MNILSFAKFVVVAGAVALGAGSAQASTLLYSVDYADPNLTDFTFSLDSNPSVSVPVPPDEPNHFFIANVANTSVNNPFELLSFYTADVSGGLAAGPDLQSLYFSYATLSLLDGSFQALFSGPVDAPTLLTGAFSLNDFDSGNAVGQLVITTVAAVPELSTWSMMIVGFCFIGYLAYRKRPAAAA